MVTYGADVWGYPQDAKEVLKAVMSRVRHEISDFFGVNRIMGSPLALSSRPSPSPLSPLFSHLALSSLT